MPAYERAHIDEIASNQWPHWIPVRHHFGIETFGMNAYRRNAGEGVVPEHDESGGGPPELYYVATGHATFSVALHLSGSCGSSTTPIDCGPRN